MFKKMILFAAVFLMVQSFAQADPQSNYDENGILLLPSEVRVFNACEGIRSSQAKYSYYAGGETFQKVSCENQQKHGLFQQFYPNGILWLEAYYKEGQLDGVSQVFDRNGNLQKYAKYEMGSVVEMKDYDKNGNQLDQGQSQSEVFNNKETISGASRGNIRPIDNIAENEFWK